MKLWNEKLYTGNVIEWSNIKKYSKGRSSITNKKEN